jgi:two-component system, sensor histidine kinase and response regulator
MQVTRKAGPHETMNPDSSIDPQALRRLRELGGEDFLRQMINLFLDLAQKKIQAARAAEQAGDLPGLEKAVHPLRSSSGNVGAQTMLELASRLEQLARQRQGEQLGSLLGELEAAFIQVKARLEQERDALGS